MIFFFCRFDRKVDVYFGSWSGIFACKTVVYCSLRAYIEHRSLFQLSNSGPLLVSSSAITDRFCRHETFREKYKLACPSERPANYSITPPTNHFALCASQQRAQLKYQCPTRFCLFKDNILSIQFLQFQVYLSINWNDCSIN